MGTNFWCCTSKYDLSHICICTYVSACVYLYHIKTGLNIGSVSIHAYACASSVLIATRNNSNRWRIHILALAIYDMVPLMMCKSDTPCSNRHMETQPYIIICWHKFYIDTIVMPLWNGSVTMHMPMSKWGYFHGNPSMGNGLSHDYKSTTGIYNLYSYR